jgi:hypothetical protein
MNPIVIIGIIIFALVLINFTIKSSVESTFLIRIQGGQSPLKF